MTSAIAKENGMGGLWKMKAARDMRAAVSLRRIGLRKQVRKPIFLILCLVFSFQMTGCVPKNNIGYYEKLSAETFLLIEDGFRDAPTEESRLKYCTSFYQFSFIYWLHTRQGSLPGSSKVDEVIRVLFARGFQDYTPAADLLKDPLRWEGKKTGDRWKVIDFENMNDDAYQVYVDEYRKFLNEKSD